MKQAQVEIVGLVVIIVFISIALLFYLDSATDKITTDTGNLLYRSYSSNELSTSFLQTYLRTHVDACGVDMEQLIRDCGRSRSLIRCGTRTSCQAINDTTQDILTSSLDVWGYPYVFSLTLDKETTITRNSFQCTALANRAAPGFFRVPYHPEPGFATLELGFCSR